MMLLSKILDSPQRRRGAEKNFLGVAPKAQQKQTSASPRLCGENFNFLEVFSDVVVK